MEVTLSEKQKQDNTNKKENIELMDKSTKSQAFFQNNSAMAQSIEAVSKKCTITRIKSRNLLR